MKCSRGTFLAVPSLAVRRFAGWWATLAAVALVGPAVAAADSRMASEVPLYTRAATQSCLTALPNAVAGLPPATPPVPPALFVYALERDDISTGGLGQPRPRAHKQLGAWYGHGVRGHHPQLLQECSRRSCVAEVARVVVRRQARPERRRHLGSEVDAEPEECAQVSVACDPSRRTTAAKRAPPRRVSRRSRADGEGTPAG